MDEGRPVIRYDKKMDDKGRIFLKPVYLKETPPEEIKRLNKTFPIARKNA